MNKAQKCAWFNLLITFSLAVIHAAAFFIIATIGPIPPALNLVGFIVVFVLIAIFAILFRRKVGLSSVDFDERDMVIGKRARLAAYIAMWILLACGCLVPWFLYGVKAVVEIPVALFPVMLYAAFIVTVFIHSAAILIQYGRGGSDEKE